MQSLSSYLTENVSLIFEGNLTRDGWEHYGDYKYAYAVIGALINGAPVDLWNRKTKSKDGAYAATPDEIEKLKDFDPTKHTMEEFDEIFNGHLKWTDIFKGKFSGYENGLASGNKGNAFEDEFCKHFESDYREEMEKALGLKEGSLMGYVAAPRGGENQRRPMIVDKGNIVLSIPNGNKNIGETVVDVELSPMYELKGKDGSLMLSLKFGPKVTFCNAGITKLFPAQAFNKYEKDGEFEPQDAGAIKGQDLLDMFGLDKNKFADTFIRYKHGKQKTDYDTDVDVLNILDKDKLFAFIKSVVGYGYILVHKLGSKTYYIDLRKESDMNKLIGTSIKSAIAHYGGIKGNSNYVSVNVELAHMDIQFDFRDKNRNPFPRSLMANYTIHH